MKFIPFRTFSEFKTRDLLRIVATQCQNGARVDELRKRVRLLDAVEAAPDDAAGIEIEDADQELMARLMSEYPWALASRDLLTIIDDVVQAKAPPPKESAAT